MDDLPTAAFAEAHPFPYITFDGLFDDALVRMIHDQFRQLPDDYWEKNSDQGIEVKWRSTWRSEWGGALEFYDATAEKVEASVLPIGNRMVIFETHDYSYHGHPTPFESPEGEERTSIILYYYTSAPRPDAQISVAGPHSALWRSKGWVDKRGQKTRSQL